MICKYSLTFCRLSFRFLDNVLWCTEVFNFDKVQFIYFSSYCLCFESISKSKVIRIYLRTHPFFVMVLWFGPFCLDQWSILSYFLYMVRGRSPTSFFFMCNYSCPTHLLKKLFFPRWMNLTPYQNSTGHRYMGLFVDFQFHFSMSILILVLHCFDYCSFVVSFQIKKYESFDFVLFQNCLAN